MIKTLLSLALLLAFSGCAKDDVITIDGVERTYSFVHPGTKGNLPLVIALHHGGALDTKVFEDYTTLTTFAQANDFIVAYPLGTNLGNKSLAGNR